MAVSESCQREYLEWFYRNCHFNMKWMGKQAQKTPFDCWTYQEIIWETTPDVVIEIGNYRGGSTLFLAHLLDARKKGQVLAVDLDHSLIDFNHPRIVWIEGEAQAMFSVVKSRLKRNDRVMVIDDSSHTKENTLALLRLYGELVTAGCYYVVEDTVLRYEFVDGPRPGPLDAIKEFLEENSDFAIDKSREKFLLSYNSDGYLKRTRAGKKRVSANLPTSRLPPGHQATHLERMEQQLAEFKAFIEEQGKIIKHLEPKEREVEALKAFIEEQGKIIKHLEPKEREVEALKAFIEEQGKIIKHLEPKEREAEALKKFIEEQGKVIRHLEGELQAERQRCGSLQTQLNKLLASKAWRTISKLRLAPL